MKRVMWFRRDLRLQDNKALAHALQNSAADELILLFQMNPRTIRFIFTFETQITRLAGHLF